MKYLKQPYYHPQVSDFVADYAGYLRRVEIFSKLDHLGLSTSCIGDVGCNAGMNSFILASIYSGVQIVGWDLRADAIAHAQWLNQHYRYNIEFVVGDSTDVIMDYVDDLDYVLISYYCVYHEEFVSIARGLKDIQARCNVILLYPEQEDVLNVQRNSEISRTLGLFPSSELIDNTLLVIPNSDIQKLTV